MIKRTHLVIRKVLPVLCAAVSGLALTGLPANAAGEVGKLPDPMAARMAAFAAQAAPAQLPAGLLRSHPDLPKTFGLMDPEGPLALFIPARDLTTAAIAAPPADGLPLGWLLLRHPSITGPQGEVPENILAHLFFWAQHRMAFLPLQAVIRGGHPEMDVLAGDGTVAFSIPLTAVPDQHDSKLANGGLSKDGACTNLLIDFPGYSAPICVGNLGATAPHPEPVEGAFKVGDPAPDFELKTLKADSTVRLSDFRGKQPVVLVFGSFT